MALSDEPYSTFVKSRVGVTAEVMKIAPPCEVVVEVDVPQLLNVTELVLSPRVTIVVAEEPAARET